MSNGSKKIMINYSPSSSVGTNLDAIDLIAIKDVPLSISTMAPRIKTCMSDDDNKKNYILSC